MLLLYIGILAVINISVGHFMSSEEIDEIFKEANCVEGRIVHTVSGGIIKVNNKIQFMPESFNHITATSTSTKMSTDSDLKSGKNSLVAINEICQFNHISSEYIVLLEEGLPHDRNFHAKLKLGDEEYFANGKSKKNAFYKLATKALHATKYQLPLEKKAEGKPVLLTPSVELNNLALKLGIKVEYINSNGDIIDEDEDNSPTYYSLDYSSKSYMEKLNDSIKQDFKKAVRVQTEDSDNTQGPFTVLIRVSDITFKGEGLTKQAARHAAADKALKHFRNLSLKDEQECHNEGVLCNKLSLKTPVSAIHEYAQQFDLKLSFDLIEQSGPAHKQIFTMACSLDNMITHGTADSKKNAKHKAAQGMLNKLTEKGSLPISNSIQVKSSKSSNKGNKKKNKKGLLANTKQYLGNAMSSFYHSLSDSSESIDTRLSDKGSSSIDESEHSTENENKDSNENGKSNKSQLLSLANSIGMNVQFSTFHNGTCFSSIVTLDAKVPQLCYDMGPTSEASENNAALQAIKFIKVVGLDNIIIPLKPSDNNKPILLYSNKKPESTNTKEEL